jgi:RND family efflux transporter MFP subunit
MKMYMALACLSLGVLLNSCSREPVVRAAAAASTPVAVHVIAVTVEQWPGIYEATGTVRARTVATLSSKVMGYVQQVNAKEGDHVSAGQLLITLEARDLDAHYRRAEIGRSEVQSAMPEADYAISGAKANLTLAQVTFNRVEDLAAKKSATTQELDEASARLKAAQSNYEMARGRRAQLDARIAEAEQEIRTAAIARDYAKIAAPFSGTVTAKTVDPGNLATPGAPLLTIEQDGALRLEASVDESKVTSIRLGASVEAAIDALDRKVNGRVSEIVPSVDPASRAYIVKIDLPAMPQLRTGMFGRACFVREPRSVLTIPGDAVIERGQLQSVFVAENGIARTRMVTLGQRGRNSAEVLSGLNSGETVIAPVPAELRDGMEIRQ